MIFFLTNFQKLLEDYGSCSGLEINHEKSEILLLGNRAYILQESNVVPDNIHNIKSVKILGVHFSYAFQARHKLNVDELISSIQHKLRIWKWRDLTIIGRIQIVKTFVIPIFLYRVSSIPMGKDFVKRSSRVSEIEDGGLKAPHLDSIIETQRELCSKKLASDQPSSWKTILLLAGDYFYVATLNCRNCR